MRWAWQVEPVAVNLSTVQFHSIGFIDAVAQALPADGVAAGLLELELTERMLMDDLADVKQRLMRLKALGLRISVDDFGTGYSSLGHLKELPIDKVKIDRSFIHDLPANRDSAAITRAIIQMGHSLGHHGDRRRRRNRGARRASCRSSAATSCKASWISAPLPMAAFEAWVAAAPGRRGSLTPDDASSCGRCSAPARPASRTQPLVGRFQLASVAWRARASGQLTGRRVLRDRRAAADRRAGADLDRRHQHAVAADVRVGADRRAVLVRAVVVGGDAAGAEVDPLADLRIAEIGQVIRLGAVAEARVLDLDEVADMNVRAEIGAGAQARERADLRTAGDLARRRCRRRCGCTGGSSRRHRPSHCGARSAHRW